MAPSSSSACTTPTRCSTCSGRSKSVTAHARKLYTKSEVPDAVMASSSSRRARSATSGTGWASPGVYPMNLLGTKANLMYDLDFTHWDESHLAGLVPAVSRSSTASWNVSAVDLPPTDMFREQLEEFALAIRGEAEVEVGAIEGIRALAGGGGARVLGRRWPGSRGGAAAGRCRRGGLKEERSMAETVDVVVAGGGHNSLITAAYLAAPGSRWWSSMPVPRRVGRRHRRADPAGLPLDSCSTGHTLIQVNPVLSGDELGLVAEYGLTYVDPDPVAHVVFPDGEHFTMWLDPDRTADEIARFSAADADAYRGMLKDWDQVKGVFGKWRFNPIRYGPSLEEALPRRRVADAGCDATHSRHGR